MGKKSRSEFHCLLCLLLRIILIVSNSKPPTSTLCLTGQEFVNYGFGKRCIWRCFVWIHLSLLFRICNVRRGFPSITLVFGLIQFQYLLKFCHYFYFTLFFWSFSMHSVGVSGVSFSHDTCLMLNGFSNCKCEYDV